MGLLSTDLTEHVSTLNATRIFVTDPTLEPTIALGTAYPHFLFLLLLSLACLALDIVDLHLLLDLRTCRTQVSMHLIRSATVQL